MASQQTPRDSKPPILDSQQTPDTATTINDSSIFHLACLNGHDAIVNQLLNMKINDESLLMKVNNKGLHPLHYAAACKTGGFCLELLMSLDIDVNMASYVEGTTPLHIAALNNRTACAQILFSNGMLKYMKDM